MQSNKERHPYLIPQNGAQIRWKDSMVGMGVAQSSAPTSRSGNEGDWLKKLGNSQFVEVD